VNKREEKLIFLSAPLPTQKAKISGQFGMRWVSDSFHLQRNLGEYIFNVIKKFLSSVGGRILISKAL
jgi:hypothetical protein